MMRAHVEVMVYRFGPDDPAKFISGAPFNEKYRVEALHSTIHARKLKLNHDMHNTSATNLT
jgi:hypothetical protein